MRLNKSLIRQKFNKTVILKLINDRVFPSVETERERRARTRWRGSRRRAVYSKYCSYSVNHSHQTQRHSVSFNKYPFTICLIEI